MKKLTVFAFLVCGAVATAQTPEQIHRTIALGDPLWLVPDATYAILRDFDLEAVRVIFFQKAGGQLVGWTANVYAVDDRSGEIEQVELDRATYTYARGVLTAVQYSESGSPIAWGGGTESEVLSGDGQLVAVTQYYGSGERRELMGEYRFFPAAIDADGRFRSAAWITEDERLPESFSFREESGLLAEIGVSYDDTDGEGYTLFIDRDGEGRITSISNWRRDVPETLDIPFPFTLVPGYGVPPFGAEFDRMITESLQIVLEANS